MLAVTFTEQKGVSELACALDVERKLDEIKQQLKHVLLGTLVWDEAMQTLGNNQEDQP